jgi:hypothetical protein
MPLRVRSPLSLFFFLFQARAPDVDSQHVAATVSMGEDGEIALPEEGPSEESAEMSEDDEDGDDEDEDEDEDEDGDQDAALEFEADNFLVVDEVS